MVSLSSWIAEPFSNDKTTVQSYSRLGICFFTHRPSESHWTFVVFEVKNTYTIKLFAENWFYQESIKCWLIQRVFHQRIRWVKSKWLWKYDSETGTEAG